MWHLVPDPIDDTQKFKSYMVRLEQGLEVASHHRGTNQLQEPLKVNALGNTYNDTKFDSGATVSREEFDKQSLDFKRIIADMKKELINAVKETQQFRPPPIRDQRNRTHDGRAICFKCEKPGHLAKFCRQPMNRPENSSNYRQEQPRRHLNHLNAKGGGLVKKFIMCNGLKSLALIDTGAAITAVSRAFVNRWKGTTHRWEGPEVTLANGKTFKPQKCIHLKVEHPEGEATGTALVMNLSEVDVLLGNDFLKQFGSLKNRMVQISPTFEFQRSRGLKIIE